MGKQKNDVLSDELIADSLQIENYFKQSKSCRLAIIRVGMEHGIRSYLERYHKASPQLKFKIFLFSSFYARKIEHFMEEKRGDSYA